MRIQPVQITRWLFLGYISRNIHYLLLYEQNYNGPITDIFKKEKYKNLRIVTMLKPDSFPNMITNIDHSPLNPDPASLDNGLTPGSSTKEKISKIV